jgi:hypothetical protein
MNKTIKINQIAIDNSGNLCYNDTMKNKGNKMLYVIKRNHTEWVEAFSTLAEAQTRFDELKAENPEWNLQILLKKQK